MSLIRNYEFVDLPDEPYRIRITEGPWKDVVFRYDTMSLVNDRLKYTFTVISGYVENKTDFEKFLSRLLHQILIDIPTNEPSNPNPIKPSWISRLLSACNPLSKIRILRR